MAWSCIACQGKVRLSKADTAQHYSMQNQAQRLLISHARTSGSRLIGTIILDIVGPLAVSRQICFVLWPSPASYFWGHSCVVG